MITYSLRQILPPVAEPLTLPEARAHCRIDDDAEDILLAGYVASARDFAEAYTNRQLCTARYRLRLDSLPSGPGVAVIALPLPPLASVEAIRYWPGDGGPEVTIDPARYRVDTDNEPGRVFLLDGWPSVDRARPGPFAVEFTAGYGGPEAIPPTIKDALRLHVGNAYAHRETLVVGTVSSELNKSVERTLTPYCMAVL